MTQTGTISWFGGPQDSTTGPTTASGAPTSTPGIAVYNEATLGGWWLMKMPNGKLTLIKQTDIGPAPSTGRKFDFTYSALADLGYSTGDFPTNAYVSGQYLGKTQVDVAKNIVQAAQNLGANTPNVAGWLSLLQQKASFAVTPASGNTAGPFDTGGLDTGNSAVQPGGPSNIVSDAGSVSKFLGNLSSASTWLRVLEVIAGLILFGLGIRQLARVATSTET